MNRFDKSFDWRRPALGALVHEVTAGVDGVVNEIDNLRLARIARLAGAPRAYGAGVDVYCKLGDVVAREQPLYRIYATNPSELEFARRQAELGHGFVVGPAAATAPTIRP